MSSRPLIAIAAAFATSLAGQASAVDWTGRVGLQYLRDDVWTPAERTSTPHLDVNVGLNLDGNVFGPGVIGYGGSVEYRRVSDTRPGESESVRNGLYYRARANLFTPRAPLSATVHAQRENDRFSSGAPGAAGFHLDVQSLGSEIRYTEPGRPTLTVGYTRTDTVNHIPLPAGIAAVPDAEQKAQYLTAGTSYGGAGFTSQASYLGTFSTGTYATDAYDNHRVDVSASANVTDKTQARISDTYYLRTPKASSPFNPSQELNSVVATVSNQAVLSDFHQGTYAYTHALQSVPGAPDVERTAHRLGYAIQRTLPNPEWRLRGSIDANLSLDRLGTAEERDAGQTLGLTAFWQRTWAGWGRLDAYGGPNIGVLEPAGGSTQLGYGATTGAAITRTTSNADLAAGYDLTYASDLGQKGTSIRQQGRGSVQAPIGEAIVRGQLTLGAERHATPLLGVGAVRTIGLGGGLSWRRYSASITGSLASGMANPVANPGIGDGLFLGLPYDSHSYALVATGTAGLTQRLAFTAIGRFLSTESPDRPGTTETEGRGMLTYAIGALSIAFEDRYSVTRVSGESVRTNLVMVSAYRAFGSRY